MYVCGDSSYITRHLSCEQSGESPVLSYPRYNHTVAIPHICGREQGPPRPFASSGNLLVRTSRQPVHSSASRFLSLACFLYLAADSRFLLLQHVILLQKEGSRLLSSISTSSSHPSRRHVVTGTVLPTLSNPWESADSDLEVVSRQYLLVAFFAISDPPQWYRAAESANVRHGRRIHSTKECEPDMRFSPLLRAVLTGHESVRSSNVVVRCSRARCDSVTVSTRVVQ